ncbi:hypothetical protein PISMIDRAFT_688443 [Pisolithus microcarpus 441]|uniref:Uncharacterized protein n=1 Tax=Pisolithus microcarpus 441 TaxID=765257 RepID=A0A0C9YIU5_9AGAM|nr:hypothetical protein PISMIDRAFT_688443 [Pisolithus microcarpus 441]
MIVSIVALKVETGWPPHERCSRKLHDHVYVPYYRTLLHPQVSLLTSIQRHESHVAATALRSSL